MIVADVTIFWANMPYAYELMDFDRAVAAILPTAFLEVAQTLPKLLPYNKWLQDNTIHNKKNSELWAYEAADSCAQPKNVWKFDQHNDFTAFFD